MRNTPSPEEKDAAFQAFRADLEKAVDRGVQNHEAKMTTMGFVFLGVFVGVIALAALLP
jgi:type II secretory pathway component PulF